MDDHPKLYYLPRLAALVAIIVVVMLTIWVSMGAAFAAALCFGFVFYIMKQDKNIPYTLSGRTTNGDGLVIFGIAFGITVCVTFLFGIKHFILVPSIFACVIIMMTISMLFLLRCFGSWVYWGKDGRAPMASEYATYRFVISKAIASIIMLILVSVQCLIGLAFAEFEIFRQFEISTVLICFSMIVALSYGLLRIARNHITTIDNSHTQTKIML